MSATVIVVAAFLAAGGWYYYQLSTRVLWTMFHVSNDQNSADAHLLEFPNGHVVLIDTGFDAVTRRRLIPHLDEKGIHRIDQIIVTHADSGHYDGMESLLQHLDAIDRVYFNPPSKAFCEQRIPGIRCDHSGVLDVINLIETSGASLRPLTTDELLYHDEERDIILEVVYTQANTGDSGAQTELYSGGTLLRLVYGNTTVLFAGDVNDVTGRRLIQDHYFLDSTLLSAPLNGTASAATDAFLDRVDPEAILVSNGARQWHGRNGDGIRRYASEKNIQTYVTGLHGNVAVALRRDGFSINTERAPLKQ